MTRGLVIACVVASVTASSSIGARQVPYRTLNDRFAPPRLTTVDAWKTHADYVRTHVLASAGLLPMPEKTPLRPVVFGEVARADYRVAKVYFESLPGFFVTGNLYRPIGGGPFPAILSPHGHWAYGRLENTALNSGPGRAIGLARLGFVVFTYDMVGYNDSQQLPHTFGGKAEHIWGLSLGGLQLWNGLRALDFLETLPEVQRDAIGMTGESGGGSQTFLLAAVDPRVKVAVPVNMISLHMQGGCLCENPPGLRLELPLRRRDPLLRQLLGSHGVLRQRAAVEHEQLRQRLGSERLLLDLHVRRRAFQPARHPGVDGLAALPVVVVREVELHRVHALRRADESEIFLHRRVLEPQRVFGPVAGGRDHQQRARRDRRAELDVVGVEPQPGRVLAQAAALHV